MPKFIDRERDLADLNRLLAREGAQFLLVYGRRRVGKTTLLTRWAAKSGLPFVYWVASRNTSAVLRQGLAQALWRLENPTAEAPIFPTWRALFQQIAKTVGSRRVVLIMDEFSYAMESASPLASDLQNAWDHLFKNSNIFLVVAGSHISVMEQLQHYQSPLYGRFTAQLPVNPLPFGALADFFPRYSAAERVAAYGILGGMPAYLERFDDRQTIKANVQAQVFDRTGMFCLEPFALIGDEVREPRNYIALLQAIGQGNHTIETIADAAGLQRAHAGGRYLKRLQELQLVERRVPATVPRDERTTRGRYYIKDNYLRFYYRFVQPNLDLLELGLLDELWEIVNSQMRSFIGTYAFEDLCQEWVLAQAHAGKLPFSPQQVGQHWAADAQVDVVAINWREKAILLGEAECRTKPVSPSLVRDLVDKAPRVIPGPDWRVYYAFFSRSGFTEAAREEIAALNALPPVDLGMLDSDLRQEVTP
jgi:AAA+ ATPase superfamily predicted ATPase